MPPKKNDILLVAPAAAGAPPDFSKIKLPPMVRFSGSRLAFARVAPWLSWDPECPLDIALPAQASVPLFELEAVFLPLSRFDATALQSSPASTCLALPFIKRALAALERDGMQEEDCGGYAELVYMLLGLARSSDSPQAYQLDPTDLWTISVPEPAVPALEWLEATTWGDWQRADGSLFRCARILAMLGCRALPLIPVLKESWMLVVSQQMDSAFAKLSDSADLPGAFRGPQVADWLISVDWPEELSVLPITASEALSEWRRFKTFATGLQAQQSSLLLAVLRRGTFALPHLDAFFSGAPMQGTTASSPELLRQLLSRLHMEAKDPRWSDFVVLDAALEDMLEIIHAVPDSEDAPLMRLHLLLEDLDAAARTSRGTARDSLPLEMTAKGDDAQILSVVPSSFSDRMNTLRRSAKLRKLILKFENILSWDSPSRNRLFKAAFTSRISSVAKFMSGVLTVLDLGDVFSRLASFRISKLKKDVCLDPLCKYLGAAVVASRVERYPKLSNFTLAHDVVIALLWGRWSKIDFEQVLVLDVAQVRCGAKQLGSGRARNIWFTESDLMSDLVRPMEALLSALGYKGPSHPNSFSSVSEQVSDAFRFARFNTATSADVQAKATASVHLAVSDAAESWVLYYQDPAPDAPFPSSFLPESSNCFAALAATTKTSDMAVDMQAEVPLFLKALAAAGQAVPVQTAPPSQNVATQAPPNKKSKPNTASAASLSAASRNTGACLTYSLAPSSLPCTVSYDHATAYTLSLYLLATA
jgi:hypothetical protein